MSTFTYVRKFCTYVRVATYVLHTVIIAKGVFVSLSGWQMYIFGKSGMKTIIKKIETVTPLFSNIFIQYLYRIFIYFIVNKFCVVILRIAYIVLTTDSPLHTILIVILHLSNSIEYN